MGKLFCTYTVTAAASLNKRDAPTTKITSELITCSLTSVWLPDLKGSAGVRVRIVEKKKGLNVAKRT